MNINRIALLLFIGAFAWPTASFAQALAANADTQAPVLTLDEAVSIALSNNRLVKNSSLEAQKYDFRVSTARSRRLPQFQFAMLGGELLQPFDFSVPAGVFGTYPGIGPIPAEKSKIHTPAVFTTYTTAFVDEPILQQYKIGLGIRATELGRDIAREDVRAERQKIAAEVRSSYFHLVATQATVDAAREAVRTLQEAQRVTAQYEEQKTVLHADALDVDARLAKARYELSVAENGMATQQENLNQLLGRGVETPFRVDPMPKESTSDLSLAAAREQARENRPEYRQAQLKEKQAGFGLRLAKAEYLPDLSLHLVYQGITNVQVLPANVTTAGFLLTWEPFDWGRKRNNVREKANEVQQARNGVTETESRIEVEVSAKYREWQEAYLLLEASRIAHEAAVEKLRVTTNKYKEQAALLRDFLQAQALSSESSSDYQRALSSYWTALAELRKAMGEE
jgi:outer membrane protein TolC